MDATTTSTITTTTTRRTINRLALPWSAAVLMAAVIAVSAAQGPAPTRGAQPAGSGVGGGASPATSPTAPSYPTIVRVFGRDVSISIHAGRGGQNLFSAMRRDCTVLASNVTLDQLRAAHPDLYRQIAPALATAWAGVE